MDRGKWKWPITGWAILAIALWTMLYGLYWHDRTGHAVFWGDALINWIGDVVMLRWVKTYQTLIGGVLALGAGAFVWITAVEQRRHGQEDSQRLRVEAGREALGRLHSTFARLVMSLAIRDVAGTQNLFLTLSTILAALPPGVSAVAAYIQLGVAVSEGHFRSATRTGAEASRDSEFKLATGKVAAITYFLRDSDRLVTAEGPLSISKATLTDNDINTLRQFGVDPWDLPWGDMLFNSPT